MSQHMEKRGFGEASAQPRKTFLKVGVGYQQNYCNSYSFILENVPGKFTETLLWIKTSFAYASLSMGPHSKMFKLISHVSYFPNASSFVTILLFLPSTEGNNRVGFGRVSVIKRRKSTATHQHVSTPTCKQPQETLLISQIFRKKINYIVYSSSIYAHPHLKPGRKSLNFIVAMFMNRSQALPTQGSMLFHLLVMPAPYSSLQTLIVCFCLSGNSVLSTEDLIRMKEGKIPEYLFLCSVGKWRLDSEVLCFTRAKQRINKHISSGISMGNWMTPGKSHLKRQYCYDMKIMTQFSINSQSLCKTVFHYIDENQKQLI